MRLLLIGAGKMGGAMLKRWHSERKISEESVLINRQGKQFENLPFKTYSGYEALYRELGDNFSPDVCVMAIKPQDASMLEQFKDLYQGTKETCCWLSAMAGLSVGNIAHHLGSSDQKAANIIRGMPNLASLYGLSCSAIWSHKKDGWAYERCMILLKTCGEVLELKQEQDIDAFTALCGSGIAYFYLLAEELEKIAVQQGFAPEDAAKMAQYTLLGAAANASSGENPITLRLNVSSPKGVTEVAIKELTANNAFATLLAKAIDSAKGRSKELAQKLSQDSL